MEAIDIAKNYKNLVQQELSISDLTLILYGSTVYGENTSDLDICFISENVFERNHFERLKELTIKYHIDNRLRIDEEIAFEDKLLHQKSFVESAIADLPFPLINNRYFIPPIEKTRAFLTSEEMKKRLILNILTVKREVLLGNEAFVEEYSKKAWESMINVVASYCQLNNFSLDEFITALYNDPFTGKFGEMYLGYKDNLPEKRIYLESAAYKHLEEMVSEDKLQKSKGTYSLIKRFEG